MPSSARGFSCRFNPRPVKGDLHYLRYSKLESLSTLFFDFSDLNPAMSSSAYPDLHSSQARKCVAPGSCSFWWMLRAIRKASLCMLDERISRRSSLLSLILFSPHSCVNNPIPVLAAGVLAQFGVFAAVLAVGREDFNQRLAAREPARGCLGFGLAEESDAAGHLCSFASLLFSCTHLRRTRPSRLLCSHGTCILLRACMNSPGTN